MRGPGASSGCPSARPECSPHRQARIRTLSEENKPPRPSPQQPFRLPSPEELERSRIWQCIKEAYAKAERLKELGLLPQFSPEMIERMRRLQPAEDSPATELARHLAESARAQREQAEVNASKPAAAEAKETERLDVDQPAAADAVADAPATETTRKLRDGRPEIEIPHFEEAFLALMEKYPRLKPGAQVRRHHLEFIDQFLHEKHVKIARLYHFDGHSDSPYSNRSVNEAQEKLLGRHVKRRLAR
jgi:hypothetical protein